MTHCTSSHHCINLFTNSYCIWPPPYRPKPRSPIDESKVQIFGRSHPGSGVMDWILCYILLYTLLYSVILCFTLFYSVLLCFTLFFGRCGELVKKVEEAGGEESSGYRSGDLPRLGSTCCDGDRGKWCREPCDEDLWILLSGQSRIIFQHFLSLTICARCEPQYFHLSEG